MHQFTESAVEIIKSIPKGKVLTYGLVASMAGNPRGARQVARILHSMSRKHGLPWHRVVNSEGQISLSEPYNEEQRILLESEGIILSDAETIDFREFLWKINKYEDNS